MSIKEFILSMAAYLAELLLRRFTGKLIVTLDMRDGGIGHVGCHIDHTLKKVNENDINLHEIIK